MTIQTSSRSVGDRSGHVQAVLKATEILQAFDQRHRTLSLRQLADRTAIPRSTCHALVTTLVDSRFLERNANGTGYQLGPALLVLGGLIIERSKFQDVVNDVAATQLASLNVEVHVAQFVGSGVVYLQKSGQIKRLANSSGRFVRLRDSACGMAVLMALPREEAIQHLLEIPPSRREEILQDLRAQLRRGYALSEVSQPGFLALASPVRAADGRVLGAIGTADRRGAMSSRRVMEVGTAFRAAALSASRLLGYHGPKEGREAWNEPEPGRRDGKGMAATASID